MLSGRRSRIRFIPTNSPTHGRPPGAPGCHDHRTDQHAHSTVTSPLAASARKLRAQLDRWCRPSRTAQRRPTAGGHGSSTWPPTRTPPPATRCSLTRTGECSPTHTGELAEMERQLASMEAAISAAAEPERRSDDA